MASLLQNPVIAATSAVAGTVLQSAAPGVATKRGSTLVLIGEYQGAATTFAVTDSAGNTWTNLQARSSTISAVVAVCHNALAVPVSTGWFKVTTGSSVTNKVFEVLEVGWPASSYGATDQNILGTAGTAAAPTSGATGVVLGGAEFILGVAWFDDNNTNAITFTTAGVWTQANGQSFGARFAYQVGYRALTNAVGTYTYAQSSDAATTITSSYAAVFVFQPVLTVVQQGIFYATYPTASFSAT